MFKMLFVFPVLFGVGLAQKSNDTSLCDYYAQARYGANNNDTQFQLVQGIVNLAFGGGFNLTNVSSELTGILNPGNFVYNSSSNLTVNLRPWFDGSIASTNLNNQASKYFWLDSGLDPLYDYLSGATPNLVLNSTSNQYRLFTHFYQAHANLFNCSEPYVAPNNSESSLNLAYVHKFMNLNFTDLGHFINQLTLATTHYGFSTADSQGLTTLMNSRFNIRCAPADPAVGGLASLCLASDCPEWRPNPDCAAYDDITPSGAPSVVPSVSTSATTPNLPSTSIASSSTSASTTTTSSVTVATSSAVASSSTSSSSLGGGAIAGIAIGAAGGALIVAAAILFCFRKRKSRTNHQQQQPGVNPHTCQQIYQQQYPTNPHESYVSYGPTLAEMNSPHGPLSPRYMGSPERDIRSPVHEMGGEDQSPPFWGYEGQRQTK